jgi:hypothetical protein
MIDNQLIEQINQQACRSIKQRQPTVFNCLYTINNFLTDDAVIKLKEYLPTSLDSLWTPVAGQEQFNRKKLTWDSDTIIEELHNACNLLTPTISLISETSLNFLGMQIWKDGDGYSATPHQDDPIIDVSLQLYLFDNDPSLGTTFGNSKNKIEIPYIHNSGYLIFVDGVNDIIHYTTSKTPPGATRYSLYLVWSRTVKL